MSVTLNFTNNFYTYLSTIMLSNSNAHGTMSDSGDPTTAKIFDKIVKTDGTNWTTDINTQNNYNALGFGKFNYMSFEFGSGTRAFDPADYALQTKITSGLTISFVGGHYVDTDNNAALDFTITITNTTSADIAINEIGIVKQIYSGYYFLAARGVFDATLTIPANSTKTVTAKLTMPIATPSA